MNSKRTYHRRTDEEQIADLQAKIDQLQKQVESKARPDLPVLNEIPKIQTRMRKFAQLAVNYGRNDLANSTLAFIAGLDRTLDESGLPRRGARSETAEQTADWS